MRDPRQFATLGFAKILLPIFLAKKGYKISIRRSSTEISGELGTFAKKSSLLKNFGRGLSGRDFIAFFRQKMGSNIFSEPRVANCRGTEQIAS